MFKDTTHHRNSAQSDGFFEFRGHDFTRQPRSIYRCFCRGAIVKGDGFYGTNNKNRRSTELQQ